MKSDFIKALSCAAAYAVVLLLHFLLIRYGFDSAADYSNVYTFSFLLCLITLLLVAFANLIFHKQLGFVFIFVISLKLMSAAIFMKQSDFNEQPELKYSFVVLYLISIVLITVFTARLLLYPEK
jgi:hypothetical protein